MSPTGKEMKILLLKQIHDPNTAELKCVKNSLTNENPGILRVRAICL